ncbi:MAG: hypothetical protein JRJ85_22785 [Deltaproteobacteria bacterium]|nr:hypothetical protein [Deltaproteobacteria bacterium]
MYDLAKRRVLQGEKIPNPEKGFSLFEPDPELINRGKMPYPIEFSHRVLVVEDSAGFIVHFQVMGIGVTDEKVLVDVMKKLQERFNGNIYSAIFDRGFWTPNNLAELSEIVQVACLPKKLIYAALRHSMSNELDDFVGRANGPRQTQCAKDQRNWKSPEMACGNRVGDSCSRIWKWSHCMPRQRN